mgnify:CR=1 FL=1
MIWSIIVGGFIGFIAGAITKKGGAMGIIANIIAGLLGSSVGQALFGTWGPTLAGMALVPSILGAVIVIAVVSFFFFFLLNDKRLSAVFRRIFFRRHLGQRSGVILIRLRRPKRRIARSDLRYHDRVSVGKF